MFAWSQVFWPSIAWQEKANPARLRFFAVYASEEAYRAHLESPHFRKYVITTQHMIKSRKLIETVPIQLQR